MRPGPGRGPSSWRKIAGILDIRTKPATNRSFTAPGAKFRAGRLGRKRRAGFKTRYFGMDTIEVPSDGPGPSDESCGRSMNDAARSLANPRDKRPLAGARLLSRLCVRNE